MTRVSGVIAAAFLAAMPLSGAWAQGAPSSEPLDFAAKADSLKPGEWVWAPEVAPAGPLLVYVDLNRQIATVYRNGVRIAVSTVSTGKAGHETPTGVFTILQKDADHHSSTYNNAPMPFTERLTWGGVALHAGGLPGYPSSHGCVHMPLAFAKKLFDIEALGGTVIIAGGYDTPETRPAAGLLEPAVAGATPAPALNSGQDYSWNPAASASGPVSIIVSTADQQVVVLRNGVEIGRSRGQLPQTSGTKVLTYAGNHWIEVGVGKEADGSPSVEQLKLPAAFDAAMRSVIVPGTTLVLTQAPLTQHSTGLQTTVLAAADGQN